MSRAIDIVKAAAATQEKPSSENIAKVPVKVYLPPSLVTYYKHVAVDEKSSLSKLLEELLHTDFDQRNRRKSSVSR